MSSHPQARAGHFATAQERASQFPGPGHDDDDLTGKIVAGRYRLLEKLGQGGMGSVYRAEHIEIGKQFAVKVLAALYGHDDEQRRRFLHEARAASTIAHENVVDVTDFGPAPNGSVFLAMELLVGEELSDLLDREGPLPWTRTKRIVTQVCQALQAAHEQGIFHRDVKPENCFRIDRHSTKDFIKVLDFGIAKIMRSSSPDESLSQTGMVFGTPEYMSPEQARGATVDHRTDVYAVGIMLYEMVTGKVPFTGNSNLEILAQQANDPPMPPRKMAPHLAIPAELEAIILRTLSKRPEDRYPTVEALARAIDTIPTPEDSRSQAASDGFQTAVAVRMDRTRERLYITIIALLGSSVLALVAVLALLLLRG